MKKILIVLLITLLAFSMLASCENESQIPETKVSEEKASDVYQEVYGSLSFASYPQAMRQQFPKSVPGVDVSGDDNNFTISFKNYTLEQDGQSGTINGSVQYSSNKAQGTVKVSYTNFETKTNDVTMKMSGTISSKSVTKDGKATYEVTFENFSATIPSYDGQGSMSMKTTSLNGTAIITQPGYDSAEKVSFVGTYNGEKLNFKYSFVEEENQSDPSNPGQSSSDRVDAFMNDFMKWQMNYTFTYNEYLSYVDPSSSAVTIDANGKITYTNYEANGYTINGSFSGGYSYLDYDNITITDGINTITFDGKVEFSDIGNRMKFENLSVTDKKNGSIVFKLSLNGNFSATPIGDNPEQATEAEFSFKGTYNGDALEFTKIFSQEELQ